MADALTLTYDFVLPEVGSSDNTWGTKLNANFTALDALLTGFFTGGSSSDLGAGIELTGTTPDVRFHETDAVGTGAGRYRFAGATAGDFYFQKSNDETWTSTTTIWEYGHTDGIVNINPSVRLARDAGSTGAVEIGHAASSTLQFSRDTSANYLKVPNTGFLRVQNIAGTAWATVSSASGWSAGSDARMKKNVADLHYNLDTIMALRAVEFDWIDDNRHDIGFIAQEVKLLIPEIVEEFPADADIPGATSTFTLRRDAIVAVLVKAVQELHDRTLNLERKA